MQCSANLNKGSFQIRMNTINFIAVVLFVLAFSKSVSTQVGPPYGLSNSASTPTIFAPGIISTGDYETEPLFTPDGKTFYFVKSTPDMSFWTIAFSRYEKGHWTNPQVAPFSGQYSDADPFITSDGKRMFFISSRPVDPKISPNAAGSLDIYVMEKTAKGWTEPKNLGAPINSATSEYFPTMAANGTLYFGSRRGGGKGGCDLYRSRFVDGKFQQPENLGDSVNTQFDEFEPFIAPDESFMIFMAGGRPDGLGGFDLFISYNRNGQWTNAENLGVPINSPADELGGKISPDGKYFFWSSARSKIASPKSKPQTIGELMTDYHSPQNGLGDIYYINLDQLKIER
jgi:hypothetical protein